MADKRRSTDRGNQEFPVLWIDGQEIGERQYCLEELGIDDQEVYARLDPTETFKEIAVPYIAVSSLVPVLELLTKAQKCGSLVQTHIYRREAKSLLEQLMEGK